MAHLLISAAHKSSGKTTISIGLCAALRRRGLAVQPFKKGPDYIDPLWLSLAAGRSCRNLDAFIMEQGEMRDLCARHLRDADIGIIEGNKGLHDGLDIEGTNSNAALAVALSAPVILVLDSRGMTRGVAPLILGYQAFDRNVRIAGVILNHVRGPRHESKLRAVIERYTDVPVLGAVQHDPSLIIDERHLGLVPSNEAADARRHIDYIGQRIAEQVDLERVRAVAAQAPVLLPTTVPPPSPPVDVRIGIARDAAFSFYYPDDLDGLRAAGAELVPIDTLRDSRLPAIDGLFLGGGFPETQMQALAANASLRADIRAAVDAGLPVYAECGGLMYLSRQIVWGERRADMVGALPADVVMGPRPVGKGYVVLKPSGQAPWAPAAEELRAHEFHYSHLENIDPSVGYAYEVVRGHGIDGRRDGLLCRNVLASYAHLRDTAGQRWTQRFVTFVRQCKAGQVDGLRSRRHR